MDGQDAFRFYTGPPPIGPFDTEPYANLGAGKIYGAESQFRYDGANTTALVAATYSRSERNQRDGSIRLFTYDQPIVVNALISQQLSRNWRLGVRYRYGSGNPYTPVVNRIYNHNTREFDPVYGERDSGRLSPFKSLDIRIDKEYIFQTWTLTAYLDIQNATYARNVELMSWNTDYSEETPLESSPPLPAFGLKGEW